MKINFKTMKSVINVLFQGDKFPIMIRGRHGIGKSEFVYEIANMIGYKVVERRASQMTEGDILGLPKEENNSTTWKLPDWYKECCDNPRILFLDEIDRAINEVRQAIFELGDSRKISGLYLHPDTRIFGASNSGEHDQAQFYQVSSMDPAELDRWYVIELDPTIEEWVEWANDNEVLEEILEFVSDSKIEGKNVLEFDGQFEDNKVYPSRRSWTRLSKTLKPILDKEPDYFKNVKQEDFIALCYGYIGNELSISFNNFIHSTSRREAYEKIIENGDIEYCKKWTSSQHLLFINRIVKSGMVKKLVKNQIIENLAKYYLFIPNEMGVKLWSSLGDSIIKCTNQIEKDIATYNFYRFKKQKINDKNISLYFIQQFSPHNDKDIIEENEEEKTSSDGENE